MRMNGSAALFPVEMYQRVEKRIYKNPNHRGSLELQMPFEFVAKFLNIFKF